MSGKPISRRAVRVEHTCKDEVELIADYLGLRLQPTVLAAFEKHLGQCADCSAFFNTYKKTIEVTRLFLKCSPLEVWSKPANIPQGRRGWLSAFLLGVHLFVSNSHLTQ